MEHKIISISQYKNNKNKKNKTATPPSIEIIISEQYTDELADEFNKLLNKKKTIKRRK